MADAHVRTFIHAQDNLGVSYFTLNQQRESDESGYDSEASDDTIRPPSPPHYTYTGTLISPPGSPGQRMIRSRSISGGGASYITGASLSTTPLLTGPRRWSTQSAAFSTFERRLSAHRQNVYGTMAPPSEQTAIQHTRSVSVDDVEAQSGPHMVRRPIQRGEMIKARLGRLNVLRRIRKLTIGKDGVPRVESNASSSPSLRETMLRTYRRLETRSSQMSARIWRSPIARTMFACGYMMVLTLAVCAIVYGVHLLAIMSKRDS